MPIGEAYLKIKHNILDIALSGNALHAVAYEPSPYHITTKIIQKLSIDHTRFSFLDFGSGKGRVLLIACQLPFKSVIGIEFSQDLCKRRDKPFQEAHPDS